ncbi:MAG: hypothetical protein R3C19_10050 [Planctomycetaceae bacterium]
MASFRTRRSFLSTSAGLLTGATLLPTLTPIGRAATVLEPDVVRLRPEIEPLVRLIEDTPRQKLLEEIGQRVGSGLRYPELLAALLLAGVRNVEPRPSVGFKFHAVLVVNSAHLASLSSPDEDRWLPIFWALDEFKSSQARDVQEGNWTMSAVDESAVPNPEHALGFFDEAMQTWDEGKADAAAAGLCRFVGAHEVLESFAKYAARDFRSIGHKAIFLANAWRTLQTIGWHHAEPVLRSLAYAMLNHNGEPNPAHSDLDADRPWRVNLEQASQIRGGWQKGRIDDDAARSLLQTLRSATSADAAKEVVALLNAEVSPQSIFDALHVAAGELLMKQPGIVALHAVTTTNAIRYLFDTSGIEQTRRMLLLQNAAFLTLFRDALPGRGEVSDVTIDALRSGSAAESDGAVEEIFSNVGSDRFRAASGVMTYLSGGQDVQPLMNAARRLIYLKGNDSHDYKFSSAALEDFYKVSPAFRNEFLASSAYMLKGSGDNDNGLNERIRAALG